MAKQVNKGGKTPLSQKQDSSSFEDMDYSILNIDAELKAELDGKGLVARWLNTKKYMADGNFHKSGWRAYKSDRKGEVGSLDFNYGVNPDGYLIRGDLVLGVKKKEDQERWASRIRAKTARQMGKNRAEELRETLDKGGLKAEIHDGYEDND